MVYGPAPVSKANKERAGMLMSFHLNAGIFIGCLIASFAMDKVKN